VKALEAGEITNPRAPEGGMSREVEGLQLSELKEIYLEDLSARVTPRHLKNVRGKLDRILAEWGTRRAQDVEPMDAVRLRNGLVAAGRSNRTANLYVDVLRAMLRWAVEIGVMIESPLTHLRRLPERGEHRRYKRRALSDNEIELFLAAAEADDEAQASQGLRLEGLPRIPQTPLWLAFLETGARYGELRQVAWGDVDFQERILVLRAENTKSRKQRVVYWFSDSWPPLDAPKSGSDSRKHWFLHSVTADFPGGPDADQKHSTTTFSAPRLVQDRSLRRSARDRTRIDGELPC